MTGLAFTLYVAVLAMALALVLSITVPDTVVPVLVTLAEVLR